MSPSAAAGALHVRARPCSAVVVVVDDLPVVEVGELRGEDGVDPPTVHAETIGNIIASANPAAAAGLHTKTRLPGLRATTLTETLAGTAPLRSQIAGRQFAHHATLRSIGSRWWRVCAPVHKGRRIRGYAFVENMRLYRYISTPVEPMTLVQSVATEGAAVSPGAARAAA